MSSNISKNGLDFIANFEGFREYPYLCPAGYRTIGFGHVIQQNETFTKISRSEAFELLKKDLQFVELVLNKLIIVALSKPQYTALASLIYNIGCGAFQRSSLRQKVNREEFEEAALEFLKWIRVRGKIVLRLVRRRTLEAELFSSTL